jgi:GTP 3',8-cyclase
MFDKYKRRINYLRISVTDRCNLRCEYCMPAEGIKLLSHNDILSFEEMFEVAREAVELGVTKIRITGGEPLVRKGIVDFVKMLSSLEGLKELGMTTNAIYLDKYAVELAKAGLNRVNISMDTADPEKYKKITRGGDFNAVIRGIEAAKAAGLEPIKVNCVIRKSKLEPDAIGVKALTEKMELNIRYIRWMELDKGEFSEVDGGEGGKCSICNRLRLTANGIIKPCLFSNLEYDVRKLGIKNALLLAVGEKPECGTTNEVGKFYNIGG